MTWLDDLTGAACKTFLASSDAAFAAEQRGVSHHIQQQTRLGLLKAENGVPDFGPPDFRKWLGRQLKRDVFLIPLTNAANDIRGFQIRAVARDVKVYEDYLLKGEPCLIGLGEAWPHILRMGEVVLVEGFFDRVPVIPSAPNTIGTLTAGLSPVVAKLLKRLQLKTVHFLWDKDDAGARARTEALRMHKELPFRDITLPAVPYKERWVKDPGELWEVWGDEQIGVYLRHVLEY